MLGYSQSLWKQKVLAGAGAFALAYCRSRGRREQLGFAATGDGG